MSEQRRSARHLIGASAEVHLGPKTVVGVVQDVSQHGMGLALPSDLEVKTGDVIWVLANDIATYAITGTVRRASPGGSVGIEFDEILSGISLDKIDSLPLTATLEPTTGSTHDVTMEIGDPSPELGELTVGKVKEAQAAEEPTEELPEPNDE